MDKLNLSEEQKRELGIIDERKDFYFKVENALVDSEDVFENIYEAHLYVVLSRYCNNNQVAYPSVNTLMKKCFCSKNTLLKAMKSLIEKKLVKKVERNGYSNLYAVQNIQDYKVVEKTNKNTSSPREQVGCSSGGGGRCSSGEPKKELVKKELDTKKTTTNKIDNTNKLVVEEKENKNSSSSSFLNNFLKEELGEGCEPILALCTEKKDISFERIKKVIKFSKENKKGNGFIFKALKENWNVEVTEENTEKEKLELKKKIAEAKTKKLSEDVEVAKKEADQFKTESDRIDEIKNSLTQQELKELKEEARKSLEEKGSPINSILMILEENKIIRERYKLNI